MAAVTAVLVSLNLFFSNFRLSDASTHWVVMEDGKVQAQMDSVFNMKRPYDLVAFMKQEERASMLDKLKQELLSRKVEIDSTEDRDTGLEEKFYKTDKDCLAAGKQLPDLDLYISTVLPLENKGIRPADHLPAFVSGSVLVQPDCTHYVDLPYSPYAFEHLDGMRDRHKLPGSPELGLKNAITYQDNVEEYGHRIYEALQKNQTSWVLYNMAAFYWRIKGDPYNVIECVRRALHYSPRKKRDVALISLANVLHRAQKSNEAAIVVHAAIDVSRELNVNHFTLGNIYAVLGEYNKSVICFENTLRIQPDFEAAAKRKHAVICHAKLELALEAQHRSLQRTLNDLKDYQRKHDYWQQQSDKLLAEQVPLDVKLSQHAAYEELKIKEISTEIGEYCRMGGKDGKQVLMCSWGKKSDPAIELDLTAPGDQPMNDVTDSEEANVSDLNQKDGGTKDYSKPVHGEKYKFETVKVPRGVTPDYLNEEWPSKEECDVHVKQVPDARNLSSSYFPPEDIGYEVKPLLNEFLGLEEGQEHPLPWYPPVCVTLLDIPEVSVRINGDLHSISYEQRKTVPLNLKDTYHTELLLSYVNGGKVTIEELGQRILSALKQRNGPKWILFNLAGLYWRIIGNNYHAIECFRRAQYVTTYALASIPEVNLANVLYRWGRYDDALTLVRWGKNNFQYHPARQFIWGNIEWARKNYTGAVYRYNLALEAEPSYTEVTNTLRALKCYLRFHQAAQSAAATEVLSNCPTMVGSGTDISHSESRVICKHEKGEERCVIETRTRSKTGNWHGSCGQCNHCCNRCTKCVAAHSNSCQLPKGPGESPSNIHGIVLDGLNEDEIKDFLEDAEILHEEGQSCNDDECKVKVQKTSKFIKLEYIDGKVFEKAIFAHSRNELTVRAEECVIYNDGSRSEGCSRPEFKAYMKQIIEQGKDRDSLSLFVNGQLTKIVPVKVKQSGQKEHVYIHIGNNPGDGTKTNEDKVEKVPPFEAHIVINNPRQGEAGDGVERKKEIRQLSDGHLPDTRKYIKRRLHLALPKLEECRKTPKLDLRRFSSTWLSFSVKKIHIKQHINFNEVVDKQSYEEPNCLYEIPQEILVDYLPGVQYRNELEYYSETGLREVLQTMGGKLEPVEMVGTRIAKALKKNETSWVISNMAALYWRVRGNANKAIECLRIAIHSAPEHSKDVGLLSLANVLHKAKYINDAIIASSFILELSPSLVVGHFNLANLYAAREQWNFAAMFYESTLGLQDTFEPAKQRLRVIQCMRIVHPPLPKE